LNEFDEVPISNAVVEQTILIRKAVRIKMPDALIAASALVTQAIVVTRNTSDFERVAGLTALHPDLV
jgi:predicted nucleic acid-binding protein